MTILEYLSSYRGEGDQAGVQESHKIMFHEVKDEIK